MGMQLTDYYTLFTGGMVTGMVLMSIAHLLGVVIKLFKNITNGVR